MNKKFLIACVVVAAGLLLVADRASAGGMLGWWKLDEGSGITAQDSSGNKRHGSLVNGPVWTTGKLGGALEFNGTNSFVRVPDDPALTFGLAKSYTLAAWAYVPEVVAGWHGIVTKGRQAGGGAMYYGIWIGDNSGVPTWYYGPWPTWGSPVGGPGWYYIVVTQDGDAKTKTLYLNGAVDSQTVAQAGDAAGNLVFGSDQEPGDSFAGKIDDVQLYNRAVTAEQVVALMNGTLPNWVKAEKPNPADGAVGVNMPLLMWSAGETAKFHDVYFGTTPDLIKVSAHQPFTMLYLDPGAGGWQPGATYYWRVDEVESNGTVYTGDLWSFTVQPLTAFAPSPADGTQEVFPAVTLTWRAGQSAVKHHVYLGETCGAANDGAPETDKGVLVETSFPAGLLRSGTTYYWRVDEVTASSVVQRGEIWSFTTNTPADGQLVREWWLGISGTAVTTLTGEAQYPFSPTGRMLIDAFEGPTNWADYYGTRLYGWLTPPKSGDYIFWIASDDASDLWVSTNADPSNAQRIAAVSTWTAAREWGKEAGQKSAAITLQAGQKYFIEALHKEGGGDDNVAVSWQSSDGAQEVIGGAVMSTYALAPIRAAVLAPKNGAVDVVEAPTLSWYAGEKAEQHEVYFGDDAAAVAAADTSSPLCLGRQAATTFEPGTLPWGKIYYWRVDEIAGGDPNSPWKGIVWSFTTANFLLVDDFERYTDKEGRRIFDAWLDGWATGANGSTVGYVNPPFAEQKVVHGGMQSMPLDYNNVADPFYSEAEREFSPVQNWTVNGVDALTLYFQGRKANAPEKLYVTVEDSGGKVATAVNADPQALQATNWVEWKIPLGQFAGVNLAKVKKLVIGVGDRAQPVAGGAGRLYLDDIRVTK
jgi:hypothetical protein